MTTKWEKRQREKDLEFDRNKAQADTQLDREARAMAADRGISYPRAVEILRATKPELVHQSLTGKAGAPPVEPTKTKRYTYQEKVALQKQVDEAVKLALKENLISHYRFGPEYLQVNQPELWARYVRSMT
jgi:hypothetical protein